MQSMLHNHRRRDFIAVAHNSQFTRNRLWHLPALLLATAAISLAQVPFTKVADPGDIAADFYYNFGVSWGDYDQDGDVDLFLSNGLQQGNFVYRNNGDLTFTRMTSQDIGDLGSDAGDSANGVWADIDNDGDLDLYVANFSMATVFADYNNAQTAPQPDRLYLNNGSNAFARQPDSLFGPPHQYSQGAGMADFDGNGFLDIMTPTYPVPLNGPALPDVLYSNNGSLAFTNTGATSLATRGGPACWADFDDDGDMDVLVPNLDNPSWLYVNQKQETGAATFVPISQFTNGVSLSRAIDGSWGDWNNDGDWDLVLSHHNDGVFLYASELGGTYSKKSLLTDPAVHGRHIATLDYDNDGDVDLLVEAYTQASRSDGLLLLENVGSNSFLEHVFLPPQADGVGHRLGVADVDNDGFTDVFVAFSTREALGTPSEERDGLWANDGNTNHWLKLVLKGTESNRSAVGAEIRVVANISGTNLWQLRQVSAGSSLFAQHDARPNFGLGDATVADVVRIEWPSGTVQELTNIAADQILHVTEPPRIEWDSSDTLSWPASADAFHLQSAGQADGPWIDATETVATNGTRRTATLEANGSAKFYRLHMP